MNPHALLYGANPRSPFVDVQVPDDLVRWEQIGSITLEVSAEASLCQRGAPCSADMSRCLQVMTQGPQVAAWYIHGPQRVWHVITLESNVGILLRNLWLHSGFLIGIPF